ncbi:MAG: hypothetical protein ACT4QE_03405, partial [Anaerolineales bacterium]
MFGVSRTVAQSTLAVLAFLGTLISTLISTWPRPEDFITLLICVGLIAICTRFPYLVRQTDLSLAHAIGVSILFSYGVGP